MLALKLVIPEALSIKCDNAQTICLLVDKSMKLQTKLWHIDIHLHWLRQKVQCKAIHIRWVLTKEIVANKLTKALTTVKYNVFVEITGIENQKDLLASIKKEEDLWDAFQQPQTDFEYSEVYRFGADATWDIQKCLLKSSHWAQISYLFFGVAKLDIVVHQCQATH